MKYLPIALLAAACSAPPPAHEADPVDSGITRIMLRGPDIAPGDEGLHCIDIPAPAGPISGWTVKRSGVHHVNAWKRLSGTPFKTWSPCGSVASQSEFIFDASSDLTEHLPDGTKYDLPGSLVFDLHYINLGSEPLPQWVEVSFFPGDPDAEPVRGFNLGQASDPLNLAPGTTKTVTFSATPKAPLRLFSLMGHMHAHGVTETVSIGGVEAYRTDSWSDPAIVHPASLSASPSAPVKWSCTFQNDTTKAIQWGLKVETTEMCQLFGLASAHWTVGAGMLVP